MQKQKEIDYKDTNMAGVGGKENRALNKKKAESEPEYKGAGAAVGYEVWRIENFGVKRQPENTGSFFSGDSYIVLKTYHKTKDSKAFSYNVHFWLGKDSTQDERGTAAFKTVELDDLLDDVPVQYREVEGHESPSFLGIFGGKIATRDGGIASAFRNVKPTEYTARLMHFTGVKKNIRCAEVPMALSSLNKGDVFLLDNGLELILWYGPQSHFNEKREAMTYVTALKDERNHKPSMVTLDGDEDHPTFWTYLGGKGEVPEAIPDVKYVAPAPKLFEVSDASGEMLITKIAEGKGEMKRELLNPDDAFIVDCGNRIWIWVGKAANANERKMAMNHACDYVTRNNLPDWTPITRVLDGKETAQFKKVFGGASMF